MAPYLSIKQSLDAQQFEPGAYFSQMKRSSISSKHQSGGLSNPEYVMQLYKQMYRDFERLND
jgi:hypothetical protein